MSEASERLIAARRFTELASEREAALITFLSRPDDLLAVLVEAQGRAWVMDALMKGVSDVGSPAQLESDSDWLDKMTGTGHAPLHDPYRRTEGNTR